MTVTKEEKRILLEKIEARKQREAGGGRSDNQQSCAGCNSVIPATYDVCPVCGKVLKNKTEKHPAEYYKNKGRNNAIAGLVLGIVGMFFLLFGFVTPDMVLGYGIFIVIIGVFGCLASHEARLYEQDAKVMDESYVPKTGMATAGTILAILCFVLGGLLIFGGFFVY